MLYLLFFLIEKKVFNCVLTTYFISGEIKSAFVRENYPRLNVIPPLTNLKCLTCGLNADSSVQ